MSDLKRLRTFTSAGKHRREKAILRISSKSARLVGYFNVGETNVTWTYRLPHGIVSGCYEQALWVFGDRLPSADTRKRAVPEGVITAIYECCLNTLKGVIPLTQRQKRRLAPHKTHLRALANRKVSRKRKKTYLTQRGGSILTALLPPALGVLGSLF